MADSQEIADAINNVSGRAFAMVALEAYIEERAVQWTWHIDEARDLIADLQDLIIVAEHFDRNNE